VPGFNAVRLVADAKSISVRKQAAAHAAEATRRGAPGTPWFVVKVGHVGAEARAPDGL